MTNQAAASIPALGPTQQPISMGTGDFLPESTAACVKLTDHSPPSSAEVSLPSNHSKTKDVKSLYLRPLYDYLAFNHANTSGPPPVFSSPIFLLDTLGQTFFVSYPQITQTVPPTTTYLLHGAESFLRS